MLTLDMSKYELNSSNTDKNCAVYSQVLINAMLGALVDHFERNRASILTAIRPSFESEEGRRMLEKVGKKQPTDDMIIKITFAKVMLDLQRMSLCGDIIDLDPSNKAIERAFELIKRNRDETYKLCEEHGYVLL